MRRPLVKSGVMVKAGWLVKTGQRLVDRGEARPLGPRLLGRPNKEMVKNWSNTAARQSITV